VRTEGQDCLVRLVVPFAERHAVHLAPRVTREIGLIVADPEDERDIGALTSQQAVHDETPLEAVAADEEPAAIRKDLTDPGDTFIACGR